MASKLPLLSLLIAVTCLSQFYRVSNSVIAPELTRDLHLSAAELAVWAQRLVNPARVASARSKVGTDPAAIADEIVLDVAVDLETVFAAAWRALGADGEASVLAAVRDAAKTSL